MGGILCPEGAGVVPKCPDGKPCECIDVDGSCDDGDDDWGYESHDDHVDEEMYKGPCSAVCENGSPEECDQCIGEVCSEPCEIPDSADCNACWMQFKPNPAGEDQNNDHESHDDHVDEEMYKGPCSAVCENGSPEECDQCIGEVCSEPCENPVSADCNACWMQFKPNPAGEDQNNDHESHDDHVDEEMYKGPCSAECSSKAYGWLTPPECIQCLADYDPANKSSEGGGSPYEDDDSGMGGDPSPDCSEYTVENLGTVFYAYNSCINTAGCMWIDADTPNPKCVAQSSPEGAVTEADSTETGDSTGMGVDSEDCTSVCQSNGEEVNGRVYYMLEGLRSGNGKGGRLRSGNSGRQHRHGCRL